MLLTSGVRGRARPGHIVRDIPALSDVAKPQAMHWQKIYLPLFKGFQYHSGTNNVYQCSRPVPSQFETWFSEACNSRVPITHTKIKPVEIPLGRTIDWHGLEPTLIWQEDHPKWAQSLVAALNKKLLQVRQSLALNKNCACWIYAPGSL